MLFRILFIILLTFTFVCSANEKQTVKKELDGFVWLMKNIKGTEEGDKKPILTKDEIKLNKKYSKQAISIVNFRSISRRSLGSKVWKKIGKKKQNEFVSVLTRLISLNAFARSSRFLRKTTQKYGEVKISKGVATLRQTVLIKGDDENPEDSEMLIDYFFEKSRGKWRISNVAFDEITPLVETYSNQFATIIKKKGYSHLVKLMRDKKKELEKEYGSIIPN